MDRDPGCACAELRRRFVRGYDRGRHPDAPAGLRPHARNGRRLQRRIEQVLGFPPRAASVAGKPGALGDHTETKFATRGARSKRPARLNAMARRRGLLRRSARYHPRLSAALPDPHRDARQRDPQRPLGGDRCTAAMWTIPPRRMKPARAHEIPLPAAAVALLDRAAEFRAGACLPRA